MRRRLTLESLETRITPTTLGTLAFDSQHLAVNFAPPTAGTPVDPTSPASPLPSTVTLQPASPNAATSLFATIGVLAAGNLTDQYFIPNSAQGASLTLALAGSGSMTLSVLDQGGHVLGQQSGSGPLGLTVSNVPVGGVTVVVTGTTPTVYLLTSVLNNPSAAPATPPTPATVTTTPPATVTPPPPATVTTTPPLFSPGFGPLMDPYGVGTSAPAVAPTPPAEFTGNWTTVVLPDGKSIQLYDPIGRPIALWAPPPSSNPLPPPPPPMP